METIEKLPDSEFTIGAREIKKAIDAGKIKQIVVAKNCPDFLIERMGNIAYIKMFNGDQKELGTKLGKPFTIALVGYSE